MLPELLEIIEASGGDWHALEAAILERYFSGHAEGREGEEASYNRGKLANNCKLGLIAYGVIERSGSFTEFGHHLYDIRKDEVALYRDLARHILLNLNGMVMVQCIQDMTSAGEEVNLTTLREGLASRGTHYPSGGKHPSMMRLWLAKAGVFVGSRWQIDTIRLQEVLGANPDDFEILARFTATTGFSPRTCQYRRHHTATGERNCPPCRHDLRSPFPGKEPAKARSEFADRGGIHHR